MAWSVGAADERPGAVPAAVLRISQARVRDGSLFQVKTSQIGQPAKVGQSGIGDLCPAQIEMN